MASNFEQFFKSGSGNGIVSSVEGTFKYPTSPGESVTLETDGEFGISAEPLNTQLNIQASPGNYEFIPLFAAKTSNNNNLVIYIRRTSAQSLYYTVYNEDFSQIVTNLTTPGGFSFQAQDFSPSFAYDPINDILGCATSAGGSNCQFGFFAFNPGTNQLGGQFQTQVINPSGSGTPLGSICFDSTRSKFIGMSYRNTTTDNPVIVTFDSPTGVEEGRITSTRSGANGYKGGYTAYDSTNDCVYTILNGSGNSTILFRKYTYNVGNTRYEEDGGEFSASSGSNAAMMQEPHLANAYVIGDRLVFMTLRTNNLFYLNRIQVTSSGFTGSISVYSTGVTYNAGDYSSVIAPFNDRILYIGHVGAGGGEWRLLIYNPFTGVADSIDITKSLKSTNNGFPTVLTPGQSKIVLCEIDSSPSPDEVDHYIFSGLGSFLSSGITIGVAESAYSASEQGNVTLNSDKLGVLVPAVNLSIDKGTIKKDGSIALTDTQDLKLLTPPEAKKKTYLTSNITINSNTTFLNFSGFKGKVIAIGFRDTGNGSSLNSMSKTVDGGSEEPMNISELGVVGSNIGIYPGLGSSTRFHTFSNVSIDFDNAITLKASANSNMDVMTVVEVGEDVNP